MTNGRYFDGRGARPHEAQVSVEDSTVLILADGAEHRWPLAQVDADIDHVEARLSWRNQRDARLVMAAADWRALAGAAHALPQQRRRRIETRLVVGLAAFAAATALFVFVGVPLLSGPLARMTPPSLETRMGENFDRQMSVAMPRCSGEDGQAVIAGLGRRIAEHADTPFDIRVRAVQAPMVNALALPGGTVLVTDDLIREARNADEVAAVIAHEIAHIEQRHVMQAVLRSLGMGMILDAVVGGGTGAGQQAVILAGNATELSYGRKAESEADARGQALLHAQGMSSRGMATFFERLMESTGNREADMAVEFASTHPDSARRARVARASERGGAAALSTAEWELLRTTCDTVDYEQLEELRRRIDPRR